MDRCPKCYSTPDFCRCAPLPPLPESGDTRQWLMIWVGCAHCGVDQHLVDVEGPATWAELSAKLSDRYTEECREGREDGGWFWADGGQGGVFIVPLVKERV